MSAPPIGSVTPIPSRPEATTSSQRPVLESALRSISTAPTRDATASAMFTAWRALLCIQAGVDSQPCSLAMATIEPVKVIAPTNTETTIDTTATGPAASRAAG